MTFLLLGNYLPDFIVEYKFFKTEFIEKDLEGIIEDNIFF